MSDDTRTTLASAFLALSSPLQLPFHLSRAAAFASSRFSLSRNAKCVPFVCAALLGRLSPRCSSNARCRRAVGGGGLGGGGLAGGGLAGGGLGGGGGVGGARGGAGGLEGATMSLASVSASLSASIVIAPATTKPTAMAVPAARTISCPVLLMVHARRTRVRDTRVPL